MHVMLGNAPHKHWLVVTRTGNMSGLHQRLQPLSGTSSPATPLQLLGAWYTQPPGFTFTYVEACSHLNCNPTCPLDLQSMFNDSSPNKDVSATADDSGTISVAWAFVSSITLDACARMRSVATELVVICVVSDLVLVCTDAGQLCLA